MDKRLNYLLVASLVALVFFIGYSVYRNPQPENITQTDGTTDENVFENTFENSEKSSDIEAGSEASDTEDIFAEETESGDIEALETDDIKENDDTVTDSSADSSVESPTSSPEVLDIQTKDSTELTSQTAPAGQNQNTASVSSPPSGSKNADAILAGMSLSEKIYQMFFITPEALTGIGQAVQAGDSTKAALSEYPVGGLIYFASNIQTPEQIKTLISNTQSYSKIPLFIGVDEEGGIVSRIASNPSMGIEKTQPMQEIGQTGDPNKAYDANKKIAVYLKNLGFNLDFAPVADVLSNPDNTEIGTRSFGSDAGLVSDMVAKSVTGLQDNGVCAVLKHFPGHGSSRSDSHLGYANSLRSAEDFREEDFPPFQRGIESGADFVLVSHISALYLDDSGLPASLSKSIITDILKTELGFDGLVITDALNMGAITELYSSGDAVKKSVLAGTDILLMPDNFKDAYMSLYLAVESGEIPESRIDESVRKILNVKIRRGII